MSRFLTPLRMERLEDTSHDGRGTWRLLSDLVYESDVAHITITAPTGFVTDLASVPRIPVAWLLTGGIGHAAAVIHDVLYTTHVVTRQASDEVLYEAMQVLGIPKYKAWLMWAGVRVGGFIAWKRPGQPSEAKPFAEFTRPADVEAS